MDLNLLRRMAGIETKQPETISSSNATANDFRRLAGLPALPVKEDEKPEEMPEEMPEEPAEEVPAEMPEEPAEEVPAEMPEEPAEDKHEDEELPSIISSLVKQAEGKSGSELEELMMQIYDAGKADGRAEALEPAPEEKDEEEESSEEEKEETKESVVTAEKPVLSLLKFASHSHNK